MPVLRSREIPSPPPNPTSSKPKTLKTTLLEPSTPSKSVEPQLPHETTPSPNSSGLVSDHPPPMAAPSRRRSLRLASKSDSAEVAPHSSSFRTKRRRKVDVDVDVDERNGSGKSQFQLNFGVGVENGSQFDWLGLGLGLGLGGENGIRVSEEKDERIVEGVAKDRENGFLSLRSGARTVRTSVDSVVVVEDEAQVKDVKGKAVLIETGVEEDEGVSGMNLGGDDVLRLGTRRFSREEKGKGKLFEGDVMLNTEDFDMLQLNIGLNYDDEDLTHQLNAHEDVGYGGSVDNGHSDVSNLQDNVVLQGEVPVSESRSEENVGQSKSKMGRFKDIARRNASRFAHFDARQEENNVDSEDGAEEPSEQPTENVEDWPGPFATAMKIIRDRENNVGGQGQNLGQGKEGMPLISWTPRKEGEHLRPKRTAPSLQDMCLSVLAKNVDAITSLTYVPDVLRHKLTQMLCDSRRMNAHFLDLLLEGSPAEIRLPDCSWLEEDKFEKSFAACDANNLTVLQLDLCGHCLSDSSMRKALVPKGLPSLTMVSLKGACRISDIGLSALVSSAPALRSMNLSQCSLLTHVGVDNLADSLGSILRELYLDDCESLDAMRILPGLRKLQCLEVLSLGGIGSVSDKFIKQLLVSNGHNMRELVLANCVKLTDSSLKVIAEACPQLCVLDLSHLTKLTDIGMVHLANGCRGIQDLKLCRNAFSDDALAAFLETSGESLKELSLNNIAKVGQNTTVSLSRRCKNLQSLDLSWCRNLTNEALGLIADSCPLLKVLKLFGCTQVTRIFLDGHSNPHLQFIGLKLTPILGHIKRPDFQQGPLNYSAVPTV